MAMNWYRAKSCQWILQDHLDLMPALDGTVPK